MTPSNNGTQTELITPYLPFADLMVNFVLILILFTVALTVSIGLGSGEVYKTEQQHLLSTIREQLGKAAPTLVQDRNDPGGSQRFSFPANTCSNPARRLLIQKQKQQW